MLDMPTGQLIKLYRIDRKKSTVSVAYSERRTAHLHQVARCYECRNNDTAVFVHLKMAAKICPQDFLYTRNARSMVSALVKRAKPSYASEVREFAGHIGLLNRKFQDDGRGFVELADRPPIRDRACL